MRISEMRAPIFANYARDAKKACFDEGFRFAR
jgi:hypothetical protein